VCFTDGISEAASPTGEEFGDGRLLDVVAAHRDRSPGELTEAVATAAADWAGGATQDDATLIVLAIQ